MINILKWLWKGFNFVRDLVLNLFFIVFVLLLIGLFSVLSPEQKQLEGDQGALLLNLDGYLADNRDPASWRAELLREANGERVPQQISTFDLVYAIQFAAEDERIKGLVLDLNYFEGADLPALSFLGRTIQEFKDTGKPVIAFADNYSQSQYLLASYADEIYLNPIGQVSIQGLAQQNLYFKELLDKLEVTPHVFRVGTYKSAVEPFLRNDMSPEARANAQRWLTGMWDNYVAQVAENRQISRDQVAPNAAQYVLDLKALKGDATAYTQQRKLVTKLANRSQLQEALIERFGKNDDNEAKMLPFNDYLTQFEDRLAETDNDKIAVINIEGTIVDGESDEDGNVGGDTIAQLLREANNDKQVKAVILRLNTPGGSAFASEVIRQEVVNIKKAGKPVVASMGAMAASGGYWVASAADQIVADKNTITGSIGIFAILPTFDKSLHKIGVNADGVSTSELAETSAAQPLNDKTKEIIQLEIEHGYDQFLTRVAESRGLTKEQADKLGQGQVWLGQDALKYKLVDELGDFEYAIGIAGDLAKSEEQLELQWFEQKDDSLMGKLMHDLKKQSKAQIRSLVGESLGLDVLGLNHKTLSRHFGVLNQFNDPKGQYLYCLSCGTVK